MSLANDRVLSQAYRYAKHRLAVTSPEDQELSASAFAGFVGQFGEPTRTFATDLYRSTLAGPMFEDRRTRGRNS